MQGGVWIRTPVTHMRGRNLSTLTLSSHALKRTHTPDLINAATSFEEALFCILTEPRFDYLRVSFCDVTMHLKVGQKATIKLSQADAATMLMIGTFFFC